MSLKNIKRHHTKQYLKLAKSLMNRLPLMNIIIWKCMTFTHEKELKMREEIKFK